MTNWNPLNKTVPTGKEKRLMIHNHNGLNGNTQMCIKMMERVLNAESTTDTSKQLASDILSKLLDLKQSLKVRRDTE